MIGRWVWLAVLVAAPVSTSAQEVLDRRAAQAMLFHETRAELIVHPDASMSPVEAGAFEQVADQLLRQVPYYGAIAIAPDAGVNSPATTARGNYHSFAAASAAVLADCNAARAAGSRDCVVVAEVRPRRWEARAFQLSSGAASGFKRDYRRGGSGKAFAISTASGGFAVGRGAEAEASAVAACNAAGGASDCRVVVRD